MIKKISLLSVILGISLSFCYAQEAASLPTEVTDFDVSNAQTNMQNLQSSMDTVIKQLYALDAVERTGDNISDQYRSTRKEIVRVIQNIKLTTNDIWDKLDKISNYKKMMLSAYQDLQSSRTGMTDTKQYISDFASFIYKLDNKLYDPETSSVDDIKLIVNSDNIPRTLANDYLVQSMILQLNDLLNNFKDNEAQQLELLKNLNEMKSKAKASIEDYQIKLEQLQQQKNYLIQFMQLYQDGNSQQQLKINNLFDNTKSVYDKTVSLISDIKKWTYHVDFDVSKKLEKLNDIALDDDAYPLAWPLYPIENILTYFGDINFQKQYSVPQVGIQIQATQWTPLYAARDGVVYFVADNDDIGINRVLIMHTEGYITQYEYVNKSIVKPWDIVRRGQLIWYSGGEPGTRWAGFISKGGNLTFAAFKDGMAIDPLEILDSSIVRNRDTLPANYQIKYLRDKYVRVIDITNLQLMTGETLASREDQFLHKFGVGIYQQIWFRDDAARNTNIDRDMVICIAFAESTLGKFLSTSNNIGNVGNNDRWDRIPFFTAYAGARAIAVTLNNSALGGYHTINQLSRYGNKDGKIYASSPINRQTNVLKCLSQIKGYYIPEDFPFRTWPNPNLLSGAVAETLAYGESLSATK